ncbi:MAG: hypothetical protein H8E12_08285 [Rhodobacteraceae bacterium]|nr:hypothetical protein [Paracoccaceae bacterium]
MNNGKLATMLIKNSIQKLIFYWISSYYIASMSYYILFLIMPYNYVFGAAYRMSLYHLEFPLQYIAIPCFFYGIIATFFSNKFRNSKIKKQVVLTLLIIVLTILLSSPYGGMLWHFHDMQAGYFPTNWLEVLVVDGISWGLSIGWFIILTSIPYNIFGSIICFFLTKKGAKLFNAKS